jgi:16S rRNA (uracil1498-N3)-methyltransferase
VRSSSAHVFVSSLDEPVLSDEDAHHLSRVLRLRAGEVVSASDGQGGWRQCAFAAERGLDPAGPVQREPAPSPLLRVGFALTKGDKPEWAVQKLTEVGVDVIAPFAAARSVVRWDAARAERAHERLVRVAREAAMQSRRVWLPVVRPVVSFAEAVAEARAAGIEPVLAEPGGSAVSLASPCVFVGPEGGWDASELDVVRGRVGLGSTIFRAETATLAAGVLLGALRAENVHFHDR